VVRSSLDRARRRPIVSFFILKKSHDLKSELAEVWYEEQWLVELNVEMVQLTFSLGFRDSTAALVLLLAACCKRDAKSQD
jgi:hypothetical protein